MNRDLVQQIIEQSKVQLQDLYPKMAGTGVAEDLILDGEKLVENVVKRCIELIESSTQTSDPIHLVSLGYSKKIKDHFGVK